jgi:hypothetical protein
MHPEKTAQTTPVHVFDKRRNNAWKRHTHAPLMLAHDRRVLDVPLEERLQSRTSELLAWAKTMLPVINRSVRDARTQLQTGHQDIRSYFSKATVVTTGDTATPPVPSTARPGSNTTSTRPARPQQHHLPVSTAHQYQPRSSRRAILDRRRFQSARTRIATLSTFPVFPRHRR